MNHERHQIHENRLTGRNNSFVYLVSFVVVKDALFLLSDFVRRSLIYIKSAVRLPDGISLATMIFSFLLTAVSIEILFAL
jgi:hypothetical protein